MSPQSDGDELELAPAHRLDLLLQPGTSPTGKPTEGFETEAEAEAEDATRLKRLRLVRSARRRSSRAHEASKAWIEHRAPAGHADLPIRRDLLRRLVQQLKRDLPGNGKPTLASAVCFRNQRLLHIGGLLEALEPYADDELRVFTIINANWRVDARALAKLRANTIMKQFRTHLERSGVNRLPGFLVAYIHGDFDPVSGLFQLHVHGVTTVQKAKALRGLVYASDGSRRNWGYAPTVTSAAPVRCQKVSDRPRQLSYNLKAFWPSRRIVIGDCGIPVRDGRAKRIAEPIHSLVLLWLARETIPSLRLLTGCRDRGNGRLKLSDGCIRGRELDRQDRSPARSNGPSMASRGS